MGDVVDFPKQADETLVWRCDCGCLTHYAQADGGLACADCGAVAHEGPGEWRRRLPAVPAKVPETEPGDVALTNLNCREVAIRRVLNSADTDSLVALVAMHETGRLTVWGDEFSTPAQCEWLDDKLADARGLLVDDSDG